MNKFTRNTLGMILVIAMTENAIAVSNNITEWDDGFDTSGFSNQTNNGINNIASLEVNDSLVTNLSKTPLLSSETLNAMLVAIQKYERIVNNGGWSKLNSNLERGEISDEVIKLRQRLFSVGDLSRVSGNAKAFDFNVALAVKRFQARHGLIVNGVVNEKTLAALNISASYRLRQIKNNLGRIKKARIKLYNKSIIVNIPAMKVEVVEDGNIFSRHNVVVGKPDRATPIISSTLSQVNFNPYWHVPVSIVRKDLVPKIISDPTYIKKTGMRIYTTWGGKELNPRDIDFTSKKALKYAYRQDPGRGNSLGVIKLNFPNVHAVFMHDTPAKSLFTRNYRAYSSGCVRIQNIKQVVDWVLKDEKKWEKKDTVQAFSTGSRTDVNLKKRVSVRMIYITSWATPAGTVHFRNDIYSLDKGFTTASN